MRLAWFARLCVWLALVIAPLGMTSSAVSVAAAAATVAKLEPLTVVTAKGHETFQVELADTPDAREEGLMYRTSLEPDHGMLFDFKTQQNVYFWMKNTYVALDMIFITADGTVAHIETDTVPLSEKSVPSLGAVRFVLEVVAGTAARIGLQDGDKVIHRLMKGSGG